MKKIIKLFAILLMTVFLNTAFGATGETSTGETNTGELNSVPEEDMIKDDLKNEDEEYTDQSKSIKELNSEVRRLDVERATNNIKAGRLKAKIDINTFFRNDLNKEELASLKQLLYTYNKHKNTLDRRLEEESEKLNKTSNIKQGLIDNKKVIYKKLIPYVKKDKFKEYLDFIKNDVFILKESSDIKDDSIKKNIILKGKVDIIKEKIIKHKEYLNKKLKDVIGKKIDEKIISFKNSEKFLLLDIKQKETLIKTIIFKTDDKIKSQEQIEGKTTLLIKKIEIYTILKEKLEILLLEL